MSIRMRCQGCGRSLYSSNALAVVARGDRCPSCGGVLVLPCPSCGGGVTASGQAPSRRREPSPDGLPGGGGGNGAAG